MAQHEHHHEPVKNVEAQPLLAQALRLNDALSFLGSSLAQPDADRLKQLKHKPLNAETITAIQHILDPYCLATVHINPEARVKVERGHAKAQLIQNGWTSFLVKIHNEAGVTAVLQPESPNAALPWHLSSFQPRVLKEHIITEGEAGNRFLEIKMYHNKPMLANLSGLKLEYAIVQIYSKDAGTREVELGFNVGQGTQDIGFRNTTNILFSIKPSVKIKLNVKDDDGKPTMASFLITDSIGRETGKLSTVYPLPARRVPAYDEYPDFFFQKQIYRKDGEHIRLAPGKYNITYTRGPEYIPQTKSININEKDSSPLSFQLKRWINMSKLGWYSGDHHVHAAGCTHYDSPEEGVPPRDMWRQALGEDLNISAVLTWGPSWYHQKNYFTGKDDTLSTNKNIMRYDVEISGFPSSHAGHLVLLRLKEDDYPGTKLVEDWPTWTLPILKWAKAQGGVVGYAHSGWGLEPITPTEELPNYVIPKMDGIGANEYIVTVTQNAVDFYSLGDTPAKWELNMWYHTLNCGFKTMASGETDFPCITDQRVGLIRSYYKSDKPVNYDDYVQALKSGNSYVSEGGSHIMDLKVSTTNLKSPQAINISAKIAAYLPELKDTSEAATKARIDGQPFWAIERTRIKNSRKIAVELIINGRLVDTAIVEADGKINKINFNYKAERSCWAAVRVLGSSHSNPVFISVGGEPIKEKRSAEWCLQALEQCWKMKEPNIKREEKAEAKQAYNNAREIYKSIIQKS